MQSVVLAWPRKQPADAAIPLLKKMLEINPNSALAHGELGDVYATMGRRTEAVPHLEAVARCEPGDAFGLTKLAWLADLDGRAADQRKALTDAPATAERGNPALAPSTRERLRK